jgi:hypothetical protein
MMLNKFAAAALATSMMVAAATGAYGMGGGSGGGSGAGAAGAAAGAGGAGGAGMPPGGSPSMTDGTAAPGQQAMPVTRTQQKLRR